MQRILILLLSLSLAAGHAARAQREPRQLVGLLTQMREGQEVTPDSFYTHVAQLRQAIAQEADTLYRAVYRATLAHMLVENAFRSQTYQRQTASHPDSIHQWSHQEYMAHAASLYAQALAHPAVLAAEDAARWHPLLTEPVPGKARPTDLFCALWHAARRDLSSRHRSSLPSVGSLEQFYYQCGRLDEALGFVLDSLDAHGEPDSLFLLGLRQKYAATPACVEVALRQARQPRLLPVQRRALLQEAIALWPRYWRVNALKNELLQLSQPKLQWEQHCVIYPGDEVHTPLTVRNVQRAEFTLYRLPEDFDDEQPSLLKAVRKAGKKVKTIAQTFHLPDSITAVRDTLHWTAPACGRYALVAEGRTGARLCQRAEPQVSFLRVSTMGVFVLTLPDGRTRHTVMDSRTGEPLQGVEVEYWKDESARLQLLHRTHTDAQGRAIMPADKKTTLQCRIVFRRTSADRLDPYSTYLHTQAFVAPPAERGQVRFFTDRAVYRPGQMVYFSTLAYDAQAHSYNVCPEQAIEVICRDVNQKEIERHTLHTDSMGVATDSLRLPKSALPGTYSLGLEKGWGRTFRVEEYKRPTFRVEFEESQPLRFPLDSVWVKGSVRTYTSLPVAQACVVGRYRWTAGLWPLNVADESGKLDTIATDDEGRFALRVPVSQSVDGLRWGRRLSVDVDVLSQYGETQQAHFALPLCSQPLRLRAEVEHWTDRQRPEPWRLSLLGPDDKPIEAQVECTLADTSGRQALSLTLPAGRDTIPASLAHLPSGTYILSAVATVGSHTVRHTQPVTLFAIDDPTAPVDTALWVYCPRDTFALGQPARIQVASALDTAWVFCTAIGPQGVELDTIFRLQKESRIVEMPYRKEYADGLELRFGLMRHGQHHESTQRLHLALPPMQLTAQWETFRNYLQPGQTEEWILRLTCPDGTPASANVMCTIYDVALDALLSHSLHFSPPSFHHIPSLMAWGYQWRPHHMVLPYCLRLLREPSAVWPTWNVQLFPGVLMMADESAVLAGGAMLSRSAAPRAAKMNMSMAKQMVAHDAVATTEEVAQAKGELLETESAPESPVLRTDMRELALFAPQLRTDAQGRVAIAFRLPQGLTTWQLRGFAHTAQLMWAPLSRTAVARKELMARLQLPRHFRAGDRAVVAATLQCLSSDNVVANAVLEVSDSETGAQILRREFPSIPLPTCREIVEQIEIDVPHDVRSLTLRFTAQTPQGQDGEQHALPVLADEQRVTEAKAFHIVGPQHWQMDLDKLFARQHPSAHHRTLTVEYTPRPLWLALQSLPALTSQRAEDALSIAAALYALNAASHIAHQVPALREALAQADSLSPLARNEELAGLALPQTPWAHEAETETQRRARLTQLMEEAASPSTLMALAKQLSKLQLSDGNFAWWPGMRGNTFVTQRVLRLLCRIQALRLPDLPKPPPFDAQYQVLFARQDMLQKGIPPLYRQLKRWSEHHELTAADVLDFLEIIYLGKMPLNGELQTDVKRWTQILARGAKDFQRAERARVATVLHAAGRQSEAEKLLPEIRRVIAQSDGLHLAYPGGARVGLVTKIAEHVQVMEAFIRIAPLDTATHTGLQQWLLLQKRVQDWQQPLATADAIHALLQTDPGQMTDEQADHITITSRHGRSQTLASADTRVGYVRQAVDVSSPRALRVEKRTPGLSWGAVYASYSMPISQIEAQREGITVERTLPTATVEDGNAMVPATQSAAYRMGDRLVVRYTLTLDHDMQFVCLSAPRPAAAEPADTRSGYRHWGNIWAYRAVRDDRSDFFFDALPRGTYVIEEEWLLTSPGSYQLGAAALRGVLAPEFQAHTPGGRIEIVNR